MNAGEVIGVLIVAPCGFFICYALYGLLVCTFNTFQGNDNLDADPLGIWEEIDKQEGR